MAEEQQKAHETGSTTAQPAAQETAKAGGIERSEAKQEIAVERPRQRLSRGLMPGFSRGIEGPFTMMRQFVDEVDRAFSSMLGGRLPIQTPSPIELVALGGWVPAIETFEKDGKLVFRADLPGMRAEDVKVEVIGDDLVISGERAHEEEATMGASYYSERQYGCFERHIQLPDDCDGEDVEASFEDGVLTVSVAAPERKKRRGRAVEVKSKPRQEQQKKGAGEVH